MPIPKRAQTFAEFEASGDRSNVGYLGLKLGQRVRVRSPLYSGWATVVGEPPQGPGVNIQTESSRKILLVSGETIREATEPR